MIDSHCHLADDAFAGDLEAVVRRAQDAGLTSALCILSADDEQESAAAARVREVWPAVRFSVGVHPHNAGRFADRVADVETCVRGAIAKEKAVAIGEIGLDYHYDFSPRDGAVAGVRGAGRRSRAVCRCRLSSTPARPPRTPSDSCAQAGELRGVFHCFTGDVAMARAALDLGFFVSLAGIVTFPKAAELRDVARLVPSDRLLVETDSPYLAPVPFRGKRNEPSFVGRVVEVVAALRSMRAGGPGRADDSQLRRVPWANWFAPNGLAR